MLGMLLEFSLMDLLYSVLGMAIVFAVLAILICYLVIQEKVIGVFDKKKKNKTEPEAQISGAEVPAIESGISEEEIAAISAAIAAYYESSDADENVDFVVRRIRKI